MRVEIAAILLGNILINNFIFSRFLGLCPFFGVSRRVDTAVGMSLAVTFVTTLAAAVTWALQRLILEPLRVGYLQTATFILVIASLVQFVEIVMHRFVPGLYRGLGIYLPLITTNCAVLGVAVLNGEQRYGFGGAVASGLAAGLGWGLAIVLFASVRRRLELADVPPAMRGFPVAFLAAGLMSIAFSGFAGLFSRLFLR